MHSGPFGRAVKEICERVSIVQVVSEYVHLKKHGRTWTGLCPFHAEKTPSFNVNEEKKLFYCFGCQTGGNTVKFLELAGGLSFREAIRKLADVAGVQLPQEGPANPAEEAAQRERGDLMHAVQAAQETFVENLHGPDGGPAREYLAARGIGYEVAVAFGLGFGGQHSGTLVQALFRRGIPLRHAEVAGLVSRSGGGEPHERFVGRLVCPVFNLEGAVVAFSARLLPPVEEGPKYVNSPESIIFKKGEVLFGLHQARQAIRQSHAAILVEGNFDVLSLAAAGIGNVVAPMGTSMTAQQLRLLRRFTDQVTVMFDGDEAGRKASRRSVGMLVEAGMEARIAHLPKGEDPDTIVRRDGPDAIREAVARARPMVAWLVESLADVHGRTPHGLRKVVDEVRESIEAEKDPFRFGLYRQEIAQILNVDVREVRRLLRDPTAEAAIRTEVVDCPAEEASLLELLLLYPRFVQRFLDVGDPAWVTHPEARDLLTEMVNAVLSGTDDPAEMFVLGSETGGPLRARVARVLSTPEMFPADQADEVFEEMLADLQRAVYARERERLEARQKKAQEDGATEEAIGLLAEQADLKRRIDAIGRPALRRARQPAIA